MDGSAHQGKKPTDGIVRLSLQLAPGRMALAAAALWAVQVLPDLIIRPLFGALFPERSASAFDQASWERWAEALRAMRRLYWFNPNGALVAAVLLYFPVALKVDSVGRRIQRGEIFTGILNLQILMSAILLWFVPLSGDPMKAMVAGTYVLSSLVLNAAFCLIGFHLCEGRLFTPLVGFLLFYAVNEALPRILSGWSAGATILVSLCVPGIADFAWQLGTLIRRGSGFVPFPTGFLPALKRCAPVVLPVWVCLWLAGPMAFLLMDSDVPVPLSYPLNMVAIESLGAWSTMTAYFGPLLFLLWRERGFHERSRRLIAFASAGYLGWNAANGLISLVAPWRLFVYLFWPSIDPNDLGGFAFAYLASAHWNIFMPLCLFRWWVYGRFARPLLITVPLAALALPALAGGSPDDKSIGFGQVLSLVLALAVAVLTLYRASPVPVRTHEAHA